MRHAPSSLRKVGRTSDGWLSNNERSAFVSTTHRLQVAVMYASSLKTLCDHERDMSLRHTSHHRLCRVAPSWLRTIGCRLCVSWAHCCLATTGSVHRIFQADPSDTRGSPDKTELSDICPEKTGSGDHLQGAHWLGWSTVHVRHLLHEKSIHRIPAMRFLFLQAACAGSLAARRQMFSPIKRSLPGWRLQPETLSVMADIESSCNCIVSKLQFEMID